MAPETPASILIIGIGNPLRRDDGFGPAVIDRLEQDAASPRLRLLSVHQLTPEIAEDLASADRVLFVDARIPEGPGDQALALEPVPTDNPETDALTHGMGPAALLHFTRAIYGTAPEASALSAPAHDLGTGEALSKPCAALLPVAVQCIHDWVHDQL